MTDENPTPENPTPEKPSPEKPTAAAKPKRSRKKETGTAKKRKRTTKKKPSKPRGRPQGAKTQPTEHVHVELSRCRRCQSTKRGAYHNTRELKSKGLIDGKPFNKILFRRTECAACGQHRVDKSWEFDPELETAAT